jgi:hypothetical protein
MTSNVTRAGWHAVWHAGHLHKLFHYLRKRRDIFIPKNQEAVACLILVRLRVMHISSFGNPKDPSTWWSPTPPQVSGNETNQGNEAWELSEHSILVQRQVFLWYWPHWIYASFRENLYLKDRKTSSLGSWSISLFALKIFSWSQQCFEAVSARILNMVITFISMYFFLVL